MERKLVDALKAQVDSGVIYPIDELKLQLLPKFYLVPKRKDTMEIKGTAMYYLKTFQGIATAFDLPTHNAVAFFTKVLEKESELISKYPEEFRYLLLLASSGRGFVFGTTFDSYQSQDLRWCDITPIKANKVEIDKETLQYIKECTDDEKELEDDLYAQMLDDHARLKGNFYFVEDVYAWMDLRKDLLDQRQLVTEWKKVSKGAPNEKAVLPLGLRDILEFWQIYEDYCRSQLRYSADYIPNWLSDEKEAVSVASETEIPKIESQLADLKSTMLLLIRLDHFYSEIRAVLELTPQAEHLAAKQKWIQSFRSFLLKPGTIDAIEAAERIAPNKDDEKTEYFHGVKTIISAIKSDTLTRERTVCYPMLDGRCVQKNFNRNESGVIKAYQKHPMFQCFQMIRSELSKPDIAVIAPYYILHWFIHKQAPKNPFIKKSYKLTDQNTKLNSELTITEDSRVHYAQECNEHFYKNLCQWYTNVAERHPTMAAYNKNMCDALYTRCHSLAVKKDWILTESIPYYKRRMLDKTIYQVYQKLEGLFDYSHFPIYANSVCSAENMLYFFAEKQDLEIIKVKKSISKIIDDKTADEYKHLAFLTAPGIGNSFMPMWWHWDLAEWLEKVIRQNDIVQAYAVGNPDPYYPLSKMRLSEINKAVTWESEVDKTYPEDIQPYLSIVEWYIQKCCCKKIGKTMLPKVFGLYKRVFLNS